MRIDGEGRPLLPENGANKLEYRRPAVINPVAADFCTCDCIGVCDSDCHCRCWTIGNDAFYCLCHDCSAELGVGGMML